MDQAEKAPQPIEKIDYRAIAAELGVNITPEMQTVVDEIKGLEAGSERFGELLGKFQQLAEAEIDRLGKQALAKAEEVYGDALKVRVKAQIGLVVATSDLLRMAGMEDAAEESMDNAREYATNLGFDDITAKLGW